MTCTTTESVKFPIVEHIREESARNYRDRIYERYSSGFQDKGAVFDADAARRWGKAYDWYLRDWLPTNNGARIVDLACGGGSLLHYFRQRGYANLAGVDISPEQVALSRQVTEDVTQDNVLHYLQNHEGEFDLITALDLAEHFQKDEFLAFLDGCYAALRPGGRLILQTPNADTPWAASIRYGDFTHEACFQSNSLGRLMRLTGFVNVAGRELGPVPKGYSAASTLRYILWRLIRLSLQFTNVVETGTPGSGVFTRVFLMGGIKP
jgi:2-polyprenyl-3-methyl-5-hydroxy-6-metoxy-1,4-benzoquinol methylase